MCRTSRTCRYVMIANIAPTPQTELPSVSQSASWNSRIIENGLGLSIGIGALAAKRGNLHCLRFGQSPDQVRSSALSAIAAQKNGPSPGRFFIASIAQYRRGGPQ